MKRLSIFLFAIICCIPCYCQTWDIVKNDTQNYLTGEGRGETIDEADQQALASLISKLSVVVCSDFELLEGEKKDGTTEEYNRYIQNKINTYSNATLTNTEIQILSNEPDAHVVRWIKRTEIERIFSGRKAKVFEYLTNAEKAEKKGKVDDALRNLYWAYTLLKTLQHPSEVVYTDSAGQNHVLVSYIPEQINEIFEAIAVSVVSREGDNLELYFTYKERPVTSIDYTYFDGSRWSNMYSAKDGKGVLELAPGAVGENIQIKVEFAYKNEAHIDREIYSVIGVVKGASFRKSYITIKGKVDNTKAKEARVNESASNVESTSHLKKLDDESYIIDAMNKVLLGIRSKNYSELQEIFTTDGLDMFNRLVKYGNARLIGEPSYTIYRHSDRIVVRAIPMSFSFTRGTKKSFVEDIVFTFNNAGQIESLAFALDDRATTDILTKQAWPEEARISIIEFLENYKTAYALERLDYIRTIFDDNAVIIVGKLAYVATKGNIELQQPIIFNKVITRTKYTKEQYLKNLERCFASNEFINIRFANNDVIKAGKGGEIYGIQIKQDYYSTNYGDSGYLFLLVDINDPKAPIIKVRTWQPEPDPVDGLFDISHF